jgi:hypothetical protein
MSPLPLPPDLAALSRSSERLRSFTLRLSGSDLQTGEELARRIHSTPAALLRHAVRLGLAAIAQQLEAPHE